VAMLPKVATSTVSLPPPSILPSLVSYFLVYIKRELQMA